MIEAYPLCWPVGYTRTKHPQPSRFDINLTLARARDGLLSEVRLLCGKEVIISTNMPLRKDGLPYSSRRTPDDRGVAVYFILKGDQVVLACDRWITIADNLHAIRKTVEAMRGIDRWGVSDMLKRSFTGFKALPENAGESIMSWWQTLSVAEDSCFEEVTQNYRCLVKKYHPDVNKDNPEYFYVIQAAYKEAKILHGIN